MPTIGKSLTAGAIGLGMLAVSGMSASAFIACSGNTCWHTKERYEYPSHARIVIHDDGWRWGHHYRFRKHDGRGYWHGGRWMECKHPAGTCCGAAWFGRPLCITKMFDRLNIGSANGRSLVKNLS